MYLKFLHISDWFVRTFGFLFRKHARLAKDFDERLVASETWGEELKNSTHRVWIQAASLGESLLTQELVLALVQKIKQDSKDNTAQKLGLLLTSGTQEGKNELLKIKGLVNNNELNICVKLFPLFTQAYMRLALEKTRPSLVVLLETEIWPGLLLACVEHKVPLIILNARMSEKSFKRYSLMQKLWNHFDDNNVPQEVLAISELDAKRYASLFKHAAVKEMPNIKFSRATRPLNPERIETLRLLFSADLSCPILLFASVRAEEEEQLLLVIQQVKKQMPELVVVIVPKHLERAAGWEDKIKELNPEFNLRLRSTVNKDAPITCNEIIIWNTTGELVALYNLAHSVFVGGTLLSELGGQNFIEPLIYGIRPFIGPYWKNFEWVGDAPFKLGLVRVVPNIKELAQALIDDLKTKQDREASKAKAYEWLETEQGGAEQAAEAILKYLKIGYD
ncbi:3-deoxy-D-manno-octulosonic acid transferase [Desulfovibrio litoralis]|uniref:3-deoxy-D-manno-octulosonic acid transferase n=1 Tax=Desulfovibrio litoralis DSM 11393 TaxID=1121455 RepID=A0A1M7TAM0_9BACT|nr:glycosyltransferase N-terminal domain-containing protein [Desulfovibrio litoralis]SHN67758.1 3-deoxy-D-manno-octulosonic-acid transferase [Desulfovibrio litoralis DSM 11393]